MKRHLFVFLLLLTSFSLSRATCSTGDSCDIEIISRSYLWVRPQFQSVSPELICGFRENRIHARENGIRSALQIVPFGSTSVIGDEIQRYFTPFGKITFIADERNPNTDAPHNIDRELLATHFNVSTIKGTFRSELTFKPHQSTVALGLHYRQGFWYSPQKNRSFFTSISTPLTCIKNSFKLQEIIIDDGGGVNKTINPNAVATMTEAFDQSDWHYGRIAIPSHRKCDPYTKTGFADIEIKVGMEWVERYPCHLESYIGLLIPTGNKPSSNYIFEPIVGNGGHVGFMMGTYFGACIWHNKERDWEIRTEYATHSNYLFKSRQTRSIDLHYKPFSRYMELYADKDQAIQAAELLTRAKALPDQESVQAQTLYAQAQTLATPGINLLTLPVNVVPGFQYNITSAFVFASRTGFQAEGGYNFFAHRAECLSLACPWREGPALKHYDGGGFTNAVRDITGTLLLESASSKPPLPLRTDPFPQEHGLNNYDYNMIQESDLDLTSASTPCALSHTFFGSLGYRWDQCEYPTIAYVGASYECSNANNASIERWTAWAKVGISF